jgi:16S rRNA G966 N2-methylase RsmD
VSAFGPAPSLFRPDLPAPGEVTIVRGHSLDLIETCPAFDLLATDPPYAIGGEGQEHAVGAVVACVLREAATRLVPGGWAVVYAAASWRSTYYMVESVRNILTPVRTATWVKPDAKTKVSGNGWAWTSVNVILFRKPGGDKSRKYPSDLLDWIEEPPLMVGRRAQLPPRVADWSIAPFAAEGETMLDPFAGSGALLRAASARGMAALGFEQDPLEVAS